MKRCLLLAGLVGVVRWAGAEPALSSPSVRAKLPEQAVALQAEVTKSFQVPRGFQVELVAAEPLVTDPIAMAFDENGRLFVLEAASRTGGVVQGRVRVLEDSDGNGIFDGSAVYAENIPNPTALTCYGGGVFVAAAGQVLYLKDSKGDDVADIRREVFKSFGEATNGANGLVVVTGMAWGLDNRIHAVTSGRGGDVISSSSPSQSVVLREGSFSFDPRTFLVTAENGAGASGLSFDERGRKFISTPADPVRVVMYAPRYETQNPFYTLPPATWNLPGPPATRLIYPQVPVGNPAPPPIHFSAASSIAIYDGNTFPRDYVGDAFVVDSAACVVHREKIHSESFVPTAERPGDELGAEFLTVRDYSFQPTQILNAPDGTLYFTGVTRSLQFATKTNANAANPGARGRIYRVVPPNFKQPKMPPLAKLPATSLVAMLRHPNGWQRETASRLLFEHQDRATIVPLIQLLFDPFSPPLARLRALRALDGIELTLAGRPARALLESHLMRALNDTDERVREQAVLLSEKFLLKSGAWSDTLWGQLSKMGNDASPRVRWQLALTLGQSRNAGRAPALTDIARLDVKVYPAVLSALTEGAGEVFAAVFADDRVRGTPEGNEFLRGLLTIVGKKSVPIEVAQMVNLLQNISDARLVFAAVGWLEQGLAQADASLVAVVGAGGVKPLLDRAAVVSQDLNANNAARADALRFLAATGPVDPSLAVTVTQQWPVLRPAFRSEVIKIFLSRPEWLGTLVGAAQTGLIPRTDFTLGQIRFLFVYPNADVRASAESLFANWNGLQRQAVLNRQSGVLQMTGNAENGHKVFSKNCAVCHQTADEPNVRFFNYTLADVAKVGKEKLLAGILDPNHEARSSIPLILFRLRNGGLLTGFIASQTARSILVGDPQGGPHYLARSNITNQSSLHISGMPEDWETTLSQQEMADLLAYLSP